jgi:hypothetical protein
VAPEICADEEDADCGGTCADDGYDIANPVGDVIVQLVIERFQIGMNSGARAPDPVSCFVCIACGHQPLLM